jgi:hypothetical protein
MTDKPMRGTDAHQEVFSGQIARLPPFTVAFSAGLIIRSVATLWFSLVRFTVSAMYRKHDY